MERNNLIKKGLAVAVILLFIGLAFTLSINANISKESLEDELVEITTELYGIKGVKPYYVKPIKFNEENWVKRIFENVLDFI
ncbi:MAG: hypothetical protein KAQ84_05575, partial [Thermoplasmatales archaeon]|nr:hypothetical protein [Thermoplasmatales archaeon]